MAGRRGFGRIEKSLGGEIARAVGRGSRKPRSLHRGLRFAVAAGVAVSSLLATALGAPVLAGPSNVAVSLSPNPVVVGQSATISVDVTPAVPGDPTPTGTLLFYMDGVQCTSTATLDPAGHASVACVAPYSRQSQVAVIYSGDAFTSAAMGGAILDVQPAQTSTSLSATPTSGVYGQRVSLSATVTVAAPGAGIPTGTVAFRDGGVPLGTALLVAGTATLSTNAIGYGARAVTADYLGDGNYVASTSAEMTVSLGTAECTVEIAAAPNPAVIGEPVTFTTTLVPTVPSEVPPRDGVVDVFYAGYAVGSADVSNGVATLTAPAPPPGMGDLVAVYSGGTAFPLSWSQPGTVALVVNRGAATVTIHADKNPSVYGEAVVYSADVAAAPPADGMPTGSVTFSDQGIDFCAALLHSGTATCAPHVPTGFGAGTIGAAYSGDANFLPSSGQLPRTVASAGTVTTITTAPNPSVNGQDVLLTASVTVASPGSGAPTGNVGFSVDGVPTCTAALVPALGTASCTAPAMRAGGHTVVATYTGDTFFAGSTGTASHQVGAADTSLAVMAPAGTIPYGLPAAFTAHVTVVGPGAGQVTGTVTFSDGAGGTVLCSAPVEASGDATCSFAGLAAGSHTIVGVLVPWPGFKESVGSTTQTVIADFATVALSATPSPAMSGQLVTLTAWVTGMIGGGTPTGEVVFEMDGVPIPGGTISLVGFGAATSATLVVGPLTPRPHTFTATYLGNPNFIPLVPGVTSVTVLAPTTTTVTLSPVAAHAGETTTAVAHVDGGISVTPTGSVTFAVGGGPLCTAPVAADGNATCSGAGPAGTWTVDATYSGDATFAGSIGTATATIDKAPTGTTIVSQTPNPAYVGQPVAIGLHVAATVGTWTPSGMVTVTADGATICTATLDGSANASCSVAFSHAGTPDLIASYGGSPDFGPSTSSAAEHVVAAGLTTTRIVSVAPEPGKVGQPVTVRFAVTANAPAGGTPTGTVTAGVGTEVCTTTVAAGECTVTVQSAGTELAFAMYEGSDDYLPSSAEVVPHGTEPTSTPSPTATPTPTPTQTATPTASETPAATSSATARVTPPTTTTRTAGPESGSGSPIGLFSGAIVLAGILLGALASARRPRGR